MNEHRAALVPVLEEARRLGFLGPGPVEPHLDHAAGYAAVVEEQVAGAGGTWAPRRAADLGSGAGVPGLPLALRLAQTAWTLVEVSVRRAAFLRDAVGELGLEARVTVVEARVEVVGRAPEHRAGYDLVVARSFGPPAVVAEAAAPLLQPGGRAVVSEPPGGDASRWPAHGLAALGMEPGPAVVAGGAAYQVLLQRALCPERFPRRVGMPAKRPLF